MKNKSMAITASAPGKLMFTGSYAVVHGRPAVVTAVDQRLYVTVQKNGEDTFLLNAPDLGLRAYSKTIDDLAKKDLPKGVRFIEHLYKRFLKQYPQDHGIVVTSSSDFSSSFGFGSSSAVTVAFAKALLSLYEIEMSKKELFDFCYEVILDVQGVGSGFDVAAAIWGGTLFYKKPAAVVDHLPLRIDVVVGYTGAKADTPTLINMVNAKINDEPAAVSKVFDKIGKTSTALRQTLERGQLQKAGEHLSEHQTLVKKLGVSTEKLDDLVAATIAAGAFGATLSGAGGGDCMIAFTEPNKKIAVEEAILSAGGTVITIACDQEGARIENYSLQNESYEKMHFSSP